MWFNIDDHLRCLCHKRKYHRLLKLKLQRAIQRHWPNDPIFLEDLVRESWDLKEEKEELVRCYKYVVFVNNELKIDWITADSSLDDHTEQICLATALESIPNKHLPKDQIIAFKNLIGEAIVSSFEGCPAEANLIIEDAKQYINARIIECSRKWILGIATAFILPFLAIGALFACSNIAFVENQDNFWLLSCFWSVIGTYLSIVKNTGKEKLDSSAGFWLHFLRVSTQMLTGGILGGVAYLILKGSLLCPPIFNAFNDSNLGFCLFGFIAGFLEKFIPNIITSLQEKEQKNG